MLIPKRKWRYPLAIEREYSKLLVAYVKKEFEIVQTFVPEMADALIENRITFDSDDEEESLVKELFIATGMGFLFDKIRRRIKKSISPKAAISRIFSRVDRAVKNEMQGIFHSVFGVNVNLPKKPDELEVLKSEWVKENLRLLKSVDDQIMERVQGILVQKIIATADKKMLPENLTLEIQKITGLSINRAALIGADQAGKLNGRLAQYRQMSAGIDRYVWRTMGDNRVRPQHAARSGIVYRWDSPPAGGHPGEAIRCRCTAQPVIDEDSFKISPIRGTYTIPKENDIILSEEMSYENLKKLQAEMTAPAAKKWYDVHVKDIPNAVSSISSAEKQAQQAAELHKSYNEQVRDLTADKPKKTERGSGVNRKQALTNAYRSVLKSQSEGLKSLHNELAVIHDNGKRNQFTVNFSLMNSKAYHDKFENLSKHKAVNEGLYKQAAKILGHRSGTEYEDIAMLDARTGKVLVENNSAAGNMKHKCGLTFEQHAELQNSGKKFEILHNHPSSSIPSTADIRGLFNRQNAVASTVVCHDGSVYRMEKLKQFEDIDVLIAASYNKIKYSGYPDSLIEFKAVEAVIKSLEAQNVLRYKKVV